MLVFLRYQVATESSAASTTRSLIAFESQLCSVNAAQPSREQYCKVFAVKTRLKREIAIIFLGFCRSMCAIVADQSAVRRVEARDDCSRASAWHRSTPSQRASPRVLIAHDVSSIRHRGPSATDARRSDCTGNCALRLLVMRNQNIYCTFIFFIAGYFCQYFQVYFVYIFRNFSLQCRCRSSSSTNEVRGRKRVGLRSRLLENPS